MNCLNSCQRNIVEKKRIAAAITISGTGANSKTISGNKYTTAFTGGDNTISINVNCTLYVIAVGGGGAGGNSGQTNGGGGGGGGGYGVWQFDYLANTSYSVSVGASSATSAGINTTFKTTTGSLGITATGGTRGSMAPSNTVTANGGTCTLDVNASGTLISRNGGNGAGVTNNGYAGSGTNSDGIITVLGINYIYGGGGSSGTNFYNGSNIYGGLPGENGIGASTVSSTTSAGTSATTIGSGGGGANASSLIDSATRSGGSGMKGIVILIFEYQ